MSGQMINEQNKAINPDSAISKHGGSTVMSNQQQSNMAAVPSPPVALQHIPAPPQSTQQSNPIPVIPQQISAPTQQSASVVKPQQTPVRYAPVNQQPNLSPVIQQQVQAQVQAVKQPASAIQQQVQPAQVRQSASVVQPQQAPIQQSIPAVMQQSNPTSVIPQQVSITEIPEEQQQQMVQQVPVGQQPILQSNTAQSEQVDAEKSIAQRVMNQIEAHPEGITDKEIAINEGLVDKQSYINTITRKLVTMKQTHRKKKFGSREMVNYPGPGDDDDTDSSTSESWKNILNLIMAGNKNLKNDQILEEALRDYSMKLLMQKAGITNTVIGSQQQ